jgi:hypothetical protein
MGRPQARVEDGNIHRTASQVWNPTDVGCGTEVRKETRLHRLTVEYIQVAASPCPASSIGFAPSLLDFLSAHMAGCPDA